jgi:dephospho-CoA kinase
MGVPTLDADQVARDLREPGQAAYQALLDRFGTADRKELRSLLTRDPAAKADLEALLHPLIRTASREKLESLHQAHPEAPFLLYEATLLIESGRTPDFEGIIVVTAPLPDRLARISARDGVTPAEALALIEAQSTDSFRLQNAKHHIQNLGSIEDLRAQVRKILDQIKSP